MNSPKELHGHYAQLLGLIPPWAVVDVQLDMKELKVEIEVQWPQGELVHCPECEELCRIKDHREERRWRHMDTMQFQTIVKSRVPRADCPTHGAKTVKIPWAGAKSPFTLLFERFAIDVIYAARSITQAQALLRISWDQVQRIQERGVERGLARRKLDNLEYVGIDEKNFRRGHDYVSVLSDINEGRVLDVVEGRTTEAADELWQAIPEEQRNGIKAVAMDMWDAFMTSTKENVPGADIVHDKFHVAKYLGKAVDDVRKRENRELVREGNEILKGSKHLWLTNPTNWTPDQEAIFKILRQEELKVGRAWAIKEMFSKFWGYVYEKSAESFFKRWYWWATHSRLKPVSDTAKTLKRHLAGLLTYLKHRITNAVAEGLNSKIQGIKANARGFRNFRNYRISILFHCGKLNVYP
jgi:transposase